MSDLDYITDNNWSYNGWSGHSIQKDKNPEVINFNNTCLCKVVAWYDNEVGYTHQMIETLKYLMSL